MTASTLPRTDRLFFAINAVVSVSALSFIAFILLRTTESDGPDLSFMPAVNAVFNALSASFLVFGYVAIRRKNIAVHRICMVTAFALSSLFLVGYLVYHSVHGDTRFSGTGAIRVVYFAMLVSHILLSMVVVPLALTSFYFAFTRSFVRHRKLNRVFLPIWIYVSVTGVLLFFMLHGRAVESAEAISPPTLAADPAK